MCDSTDDETKVQAPAGQRLRVEKTEALARERTMKRLHAKPCAPAATVAMTDGKFQIGSDHTDEFAGIYLLHDTFATASPNLVNGLVSQLFEASRTGAVPKKHELDQALAIVRGIDPQDESEALLAVQMASIHIATMTAARKLAHAENIAQQDSAGSLVNKLSRTFAMQMDTLKRWRSTGEQNIRVQHVHVNEGGQAVVAGDMQIGGGSNENTRQPLEAVGGLGISAAMFGDLKANETSLPSPGGARVECLPVSRGTRSAEG